MMPSSEPRLTPSSAPASSPDRLAVLLIRPTRYDDDGYVVRHWRGTLPSNTLSCLNGLTEDAVKSGVLGSVFVEIQALDEAVDRVNPRRLVRRVQRPGTTILVALAGVQTNQFPRACDLAREFKALGCEVMIGGFHVSGAVAMAHALPPECQAIVDEGVTIVLGEVEDRWTALLQDAVAGRLQPVYDFLKDLPDLGTKPLPKVSMRLQKKFAVRGYGTIDAGRGCPFNCSFCTIINVQGHAMRSRGAAHIVDHIRAHYDHGRKHGIWHYFFTDDNFARNPEWEAIFDGLIALREEEGVAIDFMMQVDTVATRIPRFVEKASRAGCVQVFIGMESLRDDNLKAASKRQNKVGDYRESIAEWHARGILCHVGFIIGFPFDTYERIMEDVRTLRDEVRVDQASFFMLTPLPGSRDHHLAAKAGVPMDPDYNNFDSFRATTPHPLMSAEEWTAAYRDAWRSFYTFDHMRTALLRQNPHTYWGLFKCFLWYRASMEEGSHPMVTGFFRLKDRTSRRPSFPRESRIRFFRRRLRETTQIVIAYAKLLHEMQELWLATRIRREEYAFIGDLGTMRSRASAILDIKTNWGRLHAAMAARLRDLRQSASEPAARVSTIMTERFRALKEALGTRAEDLGGAVHAKWQEWHPLQAGTKVRSLAARLSLWRPPSVERRRALNAYWAETRARARRWELWRLNPATLVWNTARDVRNVLVFVSAMTREWY